MPRLAVLILTKNEEKNIVDCIRSAAFADEILVIDSGSTDRTQQLAERIGARFIAHPMNDGGFAGQRNYALTQTDAEWVFYLDADERLTPAAVNEIKKIVAADKQIAYRIKRSNVVFGQMMKYGGCAPDWSDRLFPRVSVHWQGKVHEYAETELAMRMMTYGMEHYTYAEWNRYFEKFNHYTTMAAQAICQSGKPVGKKTAIAHALFAFFRNYILRRGVCDGFFGFIMAIMASVYTLVKYLKVINYYRLGKYSVDNNDKNE